LDLRGSNRRLITLHNQMGGAYGIQGGDEKYVQILTSREGTHLGELGIRIRTGFIWLRTGFSGELL